jgi:hypothetical protein
MTGEITHRKCNQASDDGALVADTRPIRAPGTGTVIMPINRDGFGAWPVAAVFGLRLCSMYRREGSDAA